MWKGKENSTPNKKVVDTAPRKFPNPPPVITTPIKHFFKTPTKTSVSGGAAAAGSYSSPRISIATPTKVPAVTPTRTSVTSSVNVTLSAPVVSPAPVASNRDSVIVHSPSFTALQKRLSSPAKSPKSKSPKAKSPKAKSPARESTAPRTPLSEVKKSFILSPNGPESDSYENLYKMSRSATLSNKDVTLKKEEWHNFVSGLLEQIQEKDDLIADVQDRMEELEEKVDNMKRENFMLRDEIREKNAHIATVSSKTEVAELEARLNEERKLTEEQISQLKSEISIVEERELEDNDEVRILRRELERAREESREYSLEIERLSKKITHKNSQLKMYKAKVENFLGELEARTTPSKGKRRSNGGWGTQGGRKKSRSSVSGN